MTTQLDWIWQQLDWPTFYWQEPVIQPLLRTLRLKQGILLGKTGTVVNDQVTIASSADDKQSIRLYAMSTAILANRQGYYQIGDKGFSEGISASQYKKITKVSKATATRHLADLLEKGCIEKLPGGGRSTRYQIASKFMRK